MGAHSRFPLISQPIAKIHVAVDTTCACVCRRLTVCGTKPEHRENTCTFLLNPFHSVAVCLFILPVFNTQYYYYAAQHTNTRHGKTESTRTKRKWCVMRHTKARAQKEGNILDWCIFGLHNAFTCIDPKHAMKRKRTHMMRMCVARSREREHSTCRAAPALPGPFARKHTHILFSSFSLTFFITFYCLIICFSVFILCFSYYYYFLSSLSLSLRLALSFCLYFCVPFGYYYTLRIMYDEIQTVYRLYTEHTSYILIGWRRMDECVEIHRLVAP